MKEPRKPNGVAIWAGISAFFSSLVGLKVADLIFSNDEVRHIAEAVLVSFVVAASVWAKQRLDDARHERWAEEHRRIKAGNGEPPPPDEPPDDPPLA